MPPSRYADFPLLGWRYDGRDHIEALVVLILNASQLFFDALRSLPEDSFAAHSSGVTNWQALSVLLEHAKTHYQKARSYFPEGEGSLEDLKLSQYWLMLRDLCNILQQHAPRRAATIVIQIERNTDPEHIRQWLQDKGMRARMLTYDARFERSRQASVSGSSVDGKTLVSQEGAIAGASMDKNNKNTKSSMKKSKGKLMGEGTGSSKSVRRLRKYATATTMLIGVAIKALACYKKALATSQFEDASTTQPLNEKSKLDSAH